jgi:hypothetical protein
LAAAISEERVLVAKVRHEREGKAGKEDRRRHHNQPLSAVKGVAVSADILRAHQRRVDEGTGGSVGTPWVAE